MKAFLREVAESLHRSFGENLEELCLVFPNRRAGLFFNKYLGDSLEQPVWSPSIYTIQDLMARISELDYADELELISLLYKVYTGVRGTDESFDEFFFWGEIMLSDFDEVDKYMVNAEDIFRNLADLKDLENAFEYLSDQQIELIRKFWSSFSTGQQSEQKQQFIEIWNLLFPVYNNFRDSLQSSGIGYEGMIYRNVADIIREGRPVDLPFSRIVFIGFNALNPCEQALFSSIERSGKAEFYWDYDEYYLGNEMHEAGRFIRQNLSEFKDSGHSFSQDNLRGSDKDITVYSIPSDAGQAQLVYTILEAVRQHKELGEETAIVLADEELLIPVLNALPPSLSEINVTMGYPVTATPVFSLVEHLIALQRNLREDKGKNPRFYHGDVLPVLQHQYISLREGGDAARMVMEIHEHNLIYIDQASLEGNDLFQLIFRKIDGPENIASYLLEILEMITGKEDGEMKPVPAMELEFIYRIYTRIHRLKDVLGRLGMNFSLPTFLRLFHKFLQRTRIPFHGEPLAGLQVMGVLETRILDFDRVIVLSMNEGSFPRTGNITSFIPHNLRYGFQLPTLEYQDAIYAYYFYRLIQRSKDVHLIYNNKAEGLNSGEKSRFIYQLIYDPGFEVRELSAGFDIQAQAVEEIRVNKSEDVMAELHHFCPSKNGEGYLSPSALNSYMDCSLQFYFKYIAGIKEPEQMQEEVDPALFGTLLHEAVRNIYTSLDNPVTEKDLDEILNTPELIYASIDGAFREVFLRDGDGSPEGRNRVIREIIFTYIGKILQNDREFCPIHLESLEENFFMELPVNSVGNGHTVKIGGKIDRIDRLKDSFRVLDYKTGSGKMSIKSLEELFEQENKNRNRAAFQTFLYAKLFSSEARHGNFPITPGVYLIREIFGKDFDYHFNMGSSRSGTPLRDFSTIEPAFTEQLNNLIYSIFDPGTAFVQTEEVEICSNCLYREICRR